MLFNEKLAALKSVDDMIGRLFDTLVETGKSANTVFIFASDNGYLYGSHRLLQKGTLYEEAVRVPLVIRGTGASAPKLSREWVLNTDWAPTIAAYGYAQPGLPVDGRSLIPLLGTVPPTDWRRTILLEHPFDGVYEKYGHPYAAVRPKTRTWPVDRTDASQASTPKHSIR